MSQITPALQARLGLERAEGVVITAVTPGSAAAAIHLAQGDVVLAFAGVEIGSVADLARAVFMAPAGEPLEILILRGEEELTLTTTLAPGVAIATLEGLPAPLRARLEQLLTAGNLTPEQLERLVRVYQAQSQNVRVGTVQEVSETSLTIGVFGLDEAVTIGVTPETTIRRGREAIHAVDLLPGELVFVISMDGGETAFSVTAFGVLPLAP